MASLRPGVRTDGTPVTYVLYRLEGKQSSKTFDDHAVAEKFKDLINQVGAARALEIAQIQHRSVLKWTVEEWLLNYIDHLSGVDKRSLSDYRGYVRTTFSPAFGTVPLVALSRDDVSKWVTAAHEGGAAAKTIANKHGFLSAALAKAVEVRHIDTNPAAGTRLPRDEPSQMLFLERDEFRTLLTEIPEAWKPLVEFLVASGCRWSEATALKPSDVDQVRGTVRITRAWKRDPYRIGPTKTRMSTRTINVATRTLEKLDYTGAWLFTNPGRGRRAKGGPVRAPNFRSNVWNPAVARTWPAVDPDTGATITDPMRPRIHDLRHTCASWLIYAGRPLPAIQAHLGHESIKTTIDRYGHLDRTSAQGNADAIAAMLSTPE